MTGYVDMLQALVKEDIALWSDVGSALNRIGENLPPEAIEYAIKIYENERQRWIQNQVPVGARRDYIAKRVQEYLAEINETSSHMVAV